MRIRAFVPVLNEADILPYAVRHLQQQGIEVYALDGWSTDGSWEMLAGLEIAGRERFPSEGMAREQVCSQILQRIEVLAVQSGADWCYLTDADEIRRSGKPGETLAQGIERLSLAGYNAIDHQVYVFHPTDEFYPGDPERYLRYFDPHDAKWAPIAQQKLWRNRGPVTLAGGGHTVEFAGKRLAPEKFLLKHYPWRTSSQAIRRIRERISRRCQEEHQNGWGVHYDDLTETRSFVRDPATLTFWRDIDHPVP